MTSTIPLPVKIAQTHQKKSDQPTVAQPIETVEDFIALLNALRSKAHKIETVLQHTETVDSTGRVVKQIGCHLYCDGQLKHVLQPMALSETQFLKEQVQPLIDFYTNPPLLWPGCRGDVARACQCEINHAFHCWFDAMMNAYFAQYPKTH